MLFGLSANAPMYPLPVETFEESDETEHVPLREFPALIDDTGQVVSRVSPVLMVLLLEW